MRRLWLIITSEWFMIMIFMIILFFIILFYTPSTHAQNVVQRGNTFVQVDSSKSTKIKKDNPTMTKYFYVTVDGIKYPIYMSASGKCFILRTSKNGKVYKQYLPEITKKLNGTHTTSTRLY